jgi:hypothetical protein
LIQRKKVFCLIQSRPDPKLVRRNTEQCFELPNEVKRRHVRFASDVPYRQRVLTDLGQQIPSPAEAAKSIRSQQHCELQFNNAVRYPAPKKLRALEPHPNRHATPTPNQTFRLCRTSRVLSEALEPKGRYRFLYPPS